MVYVLLCGYLPYDINSREMLPLDTNLERLFRVQFRERSWDTISPVAKSLIKSLLETRQKSRITAKMLVEHKWVQGQKALLNTPQPVLDSPRILRRTLGKPGPSPLVATARLADRVSARAQKDEQQKQKDQSRVAWQKRDDTSTVDHSQIEIALAAPGQRERDV